MYTCLLAYWIEWMEIYEWIFWNLDGLFAEACDLDQAQHGCRIDNGACSCAYGCKSEYRYATLRECTDALKVVANYVGSWSWFFFQIKIIVVFFVIIYVWRVVRVIYVAVNRVSIKVFAFKSHKHPDTVADVKELDIGEIDVNENVQTPRRAWWWDNIHMNVLLFDEWTCRQFELFCAYNVLIRHW